MGNHKKRPDNFAEHLSILYQAFVIWRAGKFLGQPIPLSEWGGECRYTGYVLASHAHAMRDAHGVKFLWESSVLFRGFPRGRIPISPPTAVQVPVGCCRMNIPQLCCCNGIAEWSFCNWTVAVELQNDHSTIGLLQRNCRIIILQLDCCNGIAEWSFCNWAVATELQNDYSAIGLLQRNSRMIIVQFRLRSLCRLIAKPCKSSVKPCESIAKHCESIAKPCESIAKPCISMQSYAILCRLMQTYADLCNLMQIMQICFFMQIYVNICKYMLFMLLYVFICLFMRFTSQNGSMGGAWNIIIWYLLWLFILNDHHWSFIIVH